MTRQNHTAVSNASRCCANGGAAGASLSFLHDAQMHLPVSSVAFAVLLLSGCASPPISVVSNTPPTMAAPSEPPRDGKILVFVSGNARDSGQFWVREDASLATIEDMFAAPPHFASRSIMIVRRGDNCDIRLECRLNKLSRRKKEQIKVYHGDRICFYWDRCFGSSDTVIEAASRA